MFVGRSISKSDFMPLSCFLLQIIRECGLIEDLQRLPDGDLTWVEPNGENLSGGQRQRISLARAVFRNASIYLLDDPLSAVDPTGRQRIFNQVSISFLVWNRQFQYNPVITMANTIAMMISICIYVRLLATVVSFDERLAY